VRLQRWSRIDASKSQQLLLGDTVLVQDMEYGWKVGLAGSSDSIDAVTFFWKADSSNSHVELVCEM
jgi:hypothetical protein